MEFDPQSYRYPSRRTVSFAKNGMTATSGPLPAQAGLEVLRRGGNAVDAAVAMAAVLAVTEPTTNGLGSDACALVWTRGRLYGLNASGRALRRGGVSGGAQRGEAVAQIIRDFQPRPGWR